MRHSKTCARYLLWFAQEHVDFRHAEIQSILSMYKIPMVFVEKPTQKPYWIVDLPNEDCLRKIASRSVSIKNCIQLWGRANSMEHLHNNLRKALHNDKNEWVTMESTESTQICPSYIINNCCDGKKSYKIEVETFCKHYTLAEKVAKLEKFDYLPLDGPINLNKPDIKLMYLEFYGMDPNNVPEEPLDFFFGKWIVNGQRDIIQTHSLKKRSFIGNTSMDAQLSLLMANQAQVANGDVVLDPFVGSGSILIAAAHFGGYVWGSDIDYMMLHSRTRPTRFGQKSRSKEESIYGNMKQYGIASKYLDIVVSDFSLPMWRDGLQFDSIITDPPYGVREPTEKIGIERENYILTDDHLANHIPSKVDYSLAHIYCDLLNFAARYLKLGRRLVCWYPLVREEYSDDQLPSHPCLKLVANSEQVLSQLTSRRLLTYEKIQETIPHMPVDPNSGAHNFREKYFTVGENSRKERRERKAEEIAANALYIARSKNKSVNS